MRKQQTVARGLDRAAAAAASLPGVAGAGCVIAAAQLQVGAAGALLTAGAFLLLIDRRL